MSSPPLLSVVSERTGLHQYFLGIEKETPTSPLPTHFAFLPQYNKEVLCLQVISRFIISFLIKMQFSISSQNNIYTNQPFFTNIHWIKTERHLSSGVSLKLSGISTIKTSPPTVCLLPSPETLNYPTFTLYCY